jgi:hypothetical protein
MYILEFIILLKMQLLVCIINKFQNARCNDKHYGLYTWNMLQSTACDDTLLYMKKELILTDWGTYFLEFLSRKTEKSHEIPINDFYPIS